MWKGLLWSLGIVVCVNAQVTPVTITAVNPSSIQAGSAAFPIAVTGTGYDSCTQINFDGTALTTTFISATELRATVPASLITIARTAKVNAVRFQAAQGSGCTTSVAAGFSKDFVIATSTALTGTTSFPPGNACTSYQVTASATGGTPPYTFTATGLPAGMSINNTTGVIRGSYLLAAGGTFPVTLTVRDSVNATTGQNLTLQFAAGTLAISTSSLPGGTAGVAYSASLAASGGAPPYVFGTSGNNVPGLSVSPTGIISGTPTSGGNFNPTFSVSDSSACVATRTLPVQVQTTTLTITAATPTTGKVGQTYSLNLEATGGSGARTWSISAGSLPPGLGINPSTGLISGTPTTAGSFNFTVAVTDSTTTATRQFTVTVAAAPTITTDTLPAATACASYSAAFAATGGSPPYVWTATGLPGGLILNRQTGALTGVITTGGSFTFTVTILDNSQNSSQRTYTLQVGASNVAITTASLPAGTVGTAYSSSLAATGGTSPYSFALDSGAVPGLSVGTGGAITGTPTTAGSFNPSFRVTDGSACTVTRSLPLQVNSGNSTSTLAITTTSLPDGRINQGYAFVLDASGGATGARTWSVRSGSLPSGMSLSTSGVITGTPSVSGAFTVEIQVTDSANASVSRTFTLNITSGTQTLRFVTDTLPLGSTCGAYNATISASGGSGNYTWSATGLPTGLSLNAQTGVLSGSFATSGSFQITVTVTDQSGGASLQRVFTLQVSAAVVSLTTSTLPAGVVGTAYSAALAASGGTQPYTFTVAADGVPGLTLTAGTGAIAGTPTQGGTYNTIYRVTDAASCTADRVLPVTVTGGSGGGGTGTGTPPVITTTLLPQGRIGDAYSFTLTATGGTGALTWSVASGSLPDGVTLDPTTGKLSGTPTISAAFVFQVKVTDTANLSASLTIVLTVLNGILITTDTLPAAVSGQPYTFAVKATGGTAPLKFTANGLPLGLSMDAAGNISGTALIDGPNQVTVQVSDASNLTTSKTFSLNVTKAFSISTDLLPPAQTGTAYDQTLQASGGTPPLTWSVVAPPALPRGLTLNAATGQITGTPTETGDFNLKVRVLDAAGLTADKTISLTVKSGFNITTDTLTSATLNQAYTGILESSGGRTPIRWSLETGNLPAGLTLNTSGVIGGTPTVTGTFSLNLLAVDAGSLEARKTLSLTVRGPLEISATTIAPGEIGIAYRQSIAAVGGQGTITWSISTGALPTGLSLETLERSVNITGTPTRAGAFPFTLRATDAGSLVATQPFTLRVSTPLSIETLAIPGGSLRSPFNFPLVVTGGASPYLWSVAGGRIPAGLLLGSTSGLLSGTPTEAGTFTFTAQVTDNDGRRTTRALSVDIANVITLTPDSLPPGMVGSVYAQQVQIPGTTARFSVTQGALPSGLALDTLTGRIVGVPRQAGSFSFSVTASLDGGGAGSNSYTIIVAPLTIPSISIGPDSAGPAQQVPVSINFGSTLPMPIEGLLRVRFAPEDGLTSDPAVRLSAGDGQTVAFQLLPGQTRPALPPGLMLQTGTVAGTIGISLELSANGVPVTPNPAPAQALRIARAAPIIDSVTARRSGSTITVEIVAYSTSREVTSAEFLFTGGTVAQNNFTVPIGSAVAAWYQSADGRAAGSLFKITVPFTISGDVGAVNQVSATLLNAVGRSQTKNAAIQ